MMRPSSSLLAMALLLRGGLAQQVTLSAGTSHLTFIQGTNTRPHTEGPPTGVYTTHGSKITLTGLTGAIVSTTVTGTTSMASNLSSSAGPTPTNTQPCNGYVELCPRKYSNVTMVGAHNSPFVRPGNSASNQALPVKTQLDDGIRFLQAQMQWPTNGTEPHFCHTTCDLLDAGPIVGWLSQVAEWVDQHPYDVVGILLENGNYSDPGLYEPFIRQSGILRYAYEPSVFPMTLDDWPTLETLIIHGKRVVLFLDYKADQTRFPWWLDEFSQMWETPFDPVNQSFPCVVQRPPELSAESARGRMYMINHNLNAQFDVFGTEILVPAVSLLNVTNGGEGFGSLGMSVENCRADWGRAPNVLNVDYYNYGAPPGSVFEVAAKANGVSYVNTCCGALESAADTLEVRGGWTMAVILSIWTLWMVDSLAWL